MSNPSERALGGAKPIELLVDRLQNTIEEQKREIAILKAKLRLATKAAIISVESLEQASAA